MVDVVIRQNQLDYAALFRPLALFVLRGADVVLPTAIDTFRDLTGNIRSFRMEGDASQPASRVFAVEVTPNLVLRVGCERMDARLQSFPPGDVERLRDTLVAARKWLHEEAPQCTLYSEVINYTAHGVFLGPPPPELFQHHSVPAIPELGDVTGNGVTYHADLAQPKWRIQLTVDPSVVLSGGIYLQFSLVNIEGELDHQNAMSKADALFRSALSHLGLSLHEVSS